MSASKIPLSALDAPEDDGASRDPGDPRLNDLEWIDLELDGPVDEPVADEIVAFEAIADLHRQTSGVAIPKPLLEIDDGTKGYRSLYLAQLLHKDRVARMRDGAHDGRVRYTSSNLEDATTIPRGKQRRSSERWKELGVLERETDPRGSVVSINYDRLLELAAETPSGRKAQHAGADGADSAFQAWETLRGKAASIFVPFALLEAFDRWDAKRYDKGGYTTARKAMWAAQLLWRYRRNVGSWQAPHVVASYAEIGDELGGFACKTARKANRDLREAGWLETEATPRGLRYRFDGEAILRDHVRTICDSSRLDGADLAPEALDLLDQVEGATSGDMSTQADPPPPSNPGNRGRQGGEPVIYEMYSRKQPQAVETERGTPPDTHARGSRASRRDELAARGGSARDEGDLTGTGGPGNETGRPAPGSDGSGGAPDLEDAATRAGDRMAEPLEAARNGDGEIDEDLADDAEAMLVHLRDHTDGDGAPEVDREQFKELVEAFVESDGYVRERLEVDRHWPGESDEPEPEYKQIVREDAVEEWRSIPEDVRKRFPRVVELRGKIARRWPAQLLRKLNDVPVDDRSRLAELETAIAEEFGSVDRALAFLEWAARLTDGARRQLQIDSVDEHILTFDRAILYWRTATGQIDVDEEIDLLIRMVAAGHLLMLDAVLEAQEDDEDDGTDFRGEFDYSDYEG